MPTIAEPSPSELISELCADFERGWLAGRPTALEAVVASAPESIRPELFRRLLAAEARLRANGSPLTVAEAGQRFATLGPWAAAPILDHFATRTDPAKPDQPDAPSPVVIGQYELLGKLGRGGFGAVYRARHQRLKKIVALKVLFPHRVDTPVGIGRFHQEAQAVGLVNHPNVIRATDAGEADGYCYLATEFVAGCDAARVLAAVKRFPVADACELARQAADGLAAIARGGFIHRDIKPSNLLVGQDGIVRILDLGLARLTDSDDERLTGTNVVMGSGDYVSPEQARESRTADIRSDVYSLGCTLYALLAGAAPFAGGKYPSTYEKFRAHIEDPIPPIRVRCPDLSPGVEALLNRMLEKDPAHRYQTPAEVAEALAPFRAGHDLAGLVARVPTASEEAATPPPKGIEPSRIAPVSAVGAPTVSFVSAGRTGWRWAALAVLVLAAVAGAVGFALRNGSDPAVADAPPALAPVGPPAPAPAVQPPRTFPPGKWVELLDRPPVRIQWPDNEPASFADFDPARKTLNVSCRDWAMLELGAVEATAFDLEVTFSQTPWTGGIGVYFGGRDGAPQGAVRTVARSVSLGRITGGDPTAPARLSGGEVRRFVQPPARRFPHTLLPIVKVPRPFAASHVLAVAVGANGVEAVRSAGELVPDLPATFAADGERFAAAGTVGLLFDHATATVASVRVRSRP